MTDQENPGPEKIIPYEGLHEIRDRLANTLLVCTAFFGAPVIFISFLCFNRVGSASIIAVHLFVYLFSVLMACYRKKVSANTKYLFITACAFIIGILSILKWGIFGTGIVYLIFLSILITFFYGTEKGVIFTGINLIILITAAVLFNSGYLHYAFDINNFSSDMLAWASVSSVYGLFTLVVIGSIGRFLISMSANYEKLASKTADLSKTKEQMVHEIDLCRQTEIALRESEERFRTVLENLPCGVSIHDLERRHLIMNEETCRVKGFSREELTRLTVMEIAGPSFNKNYDAVKLWKDLEPGKAVRFDAMTQRKDGSLYDSEVHLSKIMLNGRPVILSLVFDITERKKIEASLALRAELERLVSEISSGAVGISYKKVDDYINNAVMSIGRKTGADHAYFSLYNARRETLELVSEWSLDNTVIPGFEKEMKVEQELTWFTRMIRSQNVVHIPDMDALPDEAQKEKVYFKSRGIKSLLILVLRQGENMIGFLGFDNLNKKKSWSEEEIVILRIIGETFTSVLYRKQAEKEEERLKAQLSTALDIAHLGPWELDIENQEFSFNDHFYRIYQASAEEVGGYKMHFDEFRQRFVHPDDYFILDEVQRIFQAPGAPRTSRFEHRILYADGKTGHVMVQVSQVKNNKGVPVAAYGVSQDITEWKLAQERLLESEEKLARSRKMESLGLLAGGVAHDLNNVLSGIVSYPELLLLDLPLDSRLRKPIETIQESGYKAVAIVHDLLAIARGAAMVKEPLNLNMIINEYLDSPEFTALSNNNPGVKFHSDLENGLFNFNGSAIHIKKVVMNLVSNASEAIEKTGNVTISTCNRYVDRPLRRYEDVNIGEYIVLSVFDDGPGITPENLDRIFEPFFTKKVMGISGTGLGLTVVWSIVQDHRGYIDVKSDKDSTRFDLYFPITRDELVGKVSTAFLGDIKGKGELVMVVDDSASQREISGRMLEALGYNHIDFSDGEKAVKYLKENSVDLILLDMIMSPGISGRETYERISGFKPGHKSLIVSGYSETGDVMAIQKLGAGAYIKKPFSLETLGREIKKELAK
ncbi:MAG: PAS domain S-box protein [Deltaproteobacteria bacterium]|nr:PAS domain S-box protein [Deltaproteobacteria bacterium]